MTPRELNRDVVSERLLDLQGSLDHLRDLGPVAPERLRGEPTIRFSVFYLLSHLVQVAVDVNSHIATTMLSRAPSDYRSSFELAAKAGAIDEELSRRLQPSVGLRNVVLHEYAAVDLGMVATAAALAQDDYGEFVRQVARWLDNRLSPT